MLVLSFILGFTLLLFGRRLVWVCVGGIGFMAGMALAAKLFQGEAESLRVMVGLGCGILGAILAFFLQRIAVGFIGFVTGGYLAYLLAGHIGSGPGPWLAALIGGIVGAVLLVMVFDWALVILSSLAGAAFLLQALHPRESLEVPVFLALSVIGVAIQSGILRRRHDQPGPAASKG